MDTPKEKWSIKNKYIIILPKKINQDHHVNGMVDNTLSSRCQMKVMDRITKEIWSEIFCIRIEMNLKDLNHQSTMHLQISKETLWTAKIGSFSCTFSLGTWKIQISKSNTHIDAPL